MVDINFDKNFKSPIVGIDEVGRGSWAGPLMAAACMLDYRKVLPNNLDDSKKLSPKVRYEIFEKLKENEFYWKDLIGMEVRQIDGTVIGVVVEIIETGSDDVLVVEKNNKKELIPFNFGEIIKEVGDNSIIVDWYI